MLCKVTGVVDSFVGDDERESFRGVNGAIISEFTDLLTEPSVSCAEGTSSFEGEKGSKTGTSGFLGEIILPKVLGRDPTATFLLGLVIGVDSFEVDTLEDFFGEVGFFKVDSNFSPPTAILPNVVGANNLEGLLVSKSEKKR